MYIRGLSNIVTAGVSPISKINNFSIDNISFDIAKESNYDTCVIDYTLFGAEHRFDEGND